MSPADLAPEWEIVERCMSQLDAVPNDSASRCPGLRAAGFLTQPEKSIVKLWWDLTPAGWAAFRAWKENRHAR